MSNDRDTPPTPSDGAERDRVDHTRKRRRLLYSQQEAEVTALVRQQMGNIRAEAIGRADLTANPFLSVWTQVAVLYNRQPSVMPMEGSEPVAGAIEASGFWPLMQRVQRDTLALREMLIRVSWDDTSGAVRFRPVFPDLVTVKCRASDPTDIVELSEWVFDERFGWTRHVYNVEGAPYYQVWTSDQQPKDVSADVLGGSFSGESYPYVWADGRPFIPYGVYHAAKTAYLWDPYTYREIVEGSLQLGVFYTFYGHLIRNASWPQRWTFNAQVAGTGVAGDSAPLGAPLGSVNSSQPRSELVTDPTTVVGLEAIDGTTGAQIGQWTVAANPSEMLASIMEYERRLVLLAGLQAPTVTRTEADVRSGASLVIGRETVREVQAIYEPVFREADQKLCAMVAAFLNRNAGGTYSESPMDYRISYAGVPESPTEAKARLDQLKAEQDAGLIGPVSAYRALHPLVTEDEAVARLASAALERERVEKAIRLLMPQNDGAQPPIQPLDTGRLQMAQGLLVAASAGEMPADTCKATLVALVGIPADTAEAMVAPIRATPPPSTPPPAPSTP